MFPAYHVKMLMVTWILANFYTCYPGSPERPARSMTARLFGSLGLAGSLELAGAGLEQDEEKNDRMSTAGGYRPKPQVKFRLLKQ